MQEAITRICPST